VNNLVVGAGQLAMFGHFLTALEAEGMAAGEGEGLLVLVVVSLEADAALEY